MFNRQHPLISMIHRNVMCFFVGGDKMEEKTLPCDCHGRISGNKSYLKCVNVININDNRATMCREIVRIHFKKQVTAER